MRFTSPSARKLSPTRRRFLRRLCSTAASASAGVVAGNAIARSGEDTWSLFEPHWDKADDSGLDALANGTVKQQAAQQREIPVSGERIPVIGVGTWLTFDVGPEHPDRDQRVGVLQRFFDHGGGMIDSSPMYGHAEGMIGYALARTEQRSDVRFEASKIWTPLDALARSQMANTERLWGVEPMALMQVHNLLNWESHLHRLNSWKADGRIRYVGITTSHGRRHEELEYVMKRHRPDFVQLTYNARDREAATRLMPLAQDLGIAVIINRPLQGGSLPDHHQSRNLPGLASELGCSSWAQFFLLWAVSHPAVTCLIPATRQLAHMDENMAVARMKMPDLNTRAAMLSMMD